MKRVSHCEHLPVYRYSVPATRSTVFPRAFVGNEFTWAVLFYVDSVLYVLNFLNSSSAFLLLEKYIT